MIELVGYAVVAVLIADWFAPLQYFKDKLGFYKQPITSWLYCTKCVGLWFGLVMTRDLFQAAIISLLSYLIGKLIDKLEEQ